MLSLPPEYSIDAGTAAISPPRDTVAIPVIWIVLLLSVLVHVAVLLFVPPLRLALRPGIDPDSPLAVELRPPPEVRAAPAPVPQPKFVPPVPPTPRAPPPRAKVPPQPAAPPAAVARAAPPAPPAPSAIAPVQPAPESKSTVVPAEPTTPERVAPPRVRDFSSDMEARQRARGAPATAASSPSVAAAEPNEEVRRDRNAMANLGVGRTPVFGGPPRQGGGVFQITRLYYSNAEFAFFGWNKDIRRNTHQLIEVRKGEHSDIRLAVIRRMIAIIRDHESGDFVWESDRLGRDVMLSARPADNAGLEDFLWREFFDEPRRAVGAR